MIEAPLTLSCGAVLPNRLAKAAMTEGLADPSGRPTAALERLYAVWGKGGCGLLLSGNVLIDGDHLERPGNVIIDAAPDGAMIDALRRWTAAAKADGAQFWAQINHAGRQTTKVVNPRPKSSSAVKLGLPGGQFGEPVALTGGEIEDLVERFVRASLACQDGGFDGMQVHAAHGYLMSQFLSPRVNQRTDEYGGSLENRARFLLDVVRAIRAAVRPGFAVSVKLNSADFQKGGFAFEDSLQVAQWLEAEGVDLIEISGGTYEQPRLLGIEGMEPVEQPGVAASTLAREAYFVDFAKAMHGSLKVPLMVTGGFRTRAAMEEALRQGAAEVIGLARPLCGQPDGAARLLSGNDALPRYEADLHLFPPALRFLTRIKLLRALDGFSGQNWYYRQIAALGETGQTDLAASVMDSTSFVNAHAKAWLKARRG
ncbi:2,4-dienoyl-CoA reductase-like NADH-dependent reductase (Old Yellow Enzyme family) [Novosphingobium kunmingense]|uniref:2,4-dienoyl-CoA reductase-like NADH-dependent reductase (Old Yellow Enzyme family) n=1 Tax=Novosphingobium kunmingense TaxID=1211806 RepID=A0A2N0H734_9SPHN|nr:NADH:flavin oxidoreductase/NADH oxidase family protein [Novosphingobium kunmingense]PKB14742.1 2,4-dienoyl-CoA reductase-like NADH-dependent reductase (Old Yellow Enzyme family) [Novosphingobium kunmingense]